MDEQGVAKEYDGSTPLDNDKHELFCHEYLIDFNVTQAGIRAGYSEKTSHASAHRVFKDVRVQARLAYLKLQLNKKKRMTAEDIRRELEYVASSRIGNIVEWNDSGMAFVKSSDNIDDSDHAAIEMIEVTESGAGGSDSGLALKTKIKMHSKLKALDMLNKMDGAYVDKVEVSASEDFTNALAGALNKSRGK
jgi:phage terminase small subunit